LEEFTAENLQLQGFRRIDRVIIER